jgi:hypothetical protein
MNEKLQNVSWESNKYELPAGGQGLFPASCSEGPNRVTENTRNGVIP